MRDLHMALLIHEEKRRLFANAELVKIQSRNSADPRS